MYRTSISIGKIFLLLMVSLCFIQCNEGEGAAGSGGEIVINDSLPGGSYDFTVSNISVNAGERSLTVSWEAPSDVSELAYYLVEWQGNNADPTLYSASCHSTTFTITHLYNDAYTIGIRGVSKNMQKSAVAYAASTYRPVEDHEGPAQAGGLVISSAAVSTLLTWMNPEDEDFEYTIIRLKAEGDSDWFLSDTLSALETEWNVAGLSEKTSYNYMLQSFDYVGNGSEPVTGSFKTKTEVQLPKVDEAGERLWDIADFSSEETAGDAGAAVNAIDNNDRTFWHSVWYSGNFGPGTSTGTLPQYIVLDLRQIVIPSVVSLYRRDGRNNGPTSVRIESTLDDPTSPNATWNNLGTYALDGGNNNGALSCNISILKDARYIKITILSANNTTYAMIREIDVKALVDEE